MDKQELRLIQLSYYNILSTARHGKLCRKIVIKTGIILSFITNETCTFMTIPLLLHEAILQCSIPFSYILSLLLLICGHAIQKTVNLWIKCKHNLYKHTGLFVNPSFFYIMFKEFSFVLVYMTSLNF